MKKILIPLLFIAFLLAYSCKKSDYKETILEARTSLNERFKNPKTSPLIDEDIKNFKGLNYFDVDERYRVPAVIEKIDSVKVFEMEYTRKQKYLYRKYGLLKFKINGKDLQLYAYLNHNDSLDEAAKTRLFVPFTDLTNDSLTYEGGRYLEIAIPDDNTTELDFNNAYNPYCAFSNNYACPKVPAENNIPMAVMAGEKRFK